MKTNVTQNFGDPLKAREKKQSFWKKSFIYDLIILFILISLFSWIYIFNPKNVLQNLGLKPNPKILYSHIEFKENLEYLEKRNMAYVEYKSSDMLGINNTIKWYEFLAIEEKQKKEGWDGEIEVKIKNEGKSGLILVQAFYGEKKEKSLMLKRNEYATLHFIFAKTNNGGKYVVQIQSLE